jgi:N-acetylglucosaminyl-diphospho-decaprenol L-rhamnosyltransferase
MKLSAIVVNYNAGDHLAACIRSLQSAAIKEIVVVDNGSVDGSLDAVRDEVEVIETGSNLGYGGGVNRGLPHVSGDTVLVINPDAVLHDGALGVMVGVLERVQAVGVVGPRVVEVDGSVYPSARAFPRLIDAIGHAFIGLVTTKNPFSRRYLLTGTDQLTARNVDWVSGACFLARRRALDDVHGFDDGYFMYLEEVDLCWRLGRAGWRIRYEPAAVVTHVGGVSTSQVPYRMLAAHHRALFRYWWRTTSPSRRVLAPAVAVGLVLRLAVMSARRSLSTFVGGALRGGPSGR